MSSESTIVVPPLVVPQLNTARTVRVAALIGAADGGKSRIGDVITVAGWSRTVRKHGKEFCFISLSDGTSPQNLQVVVNSEMPDYDKISKCGVGCSFKIVGTVVESPAAGQAVELHAKDPEKHRVVIFGTTDQGSYPLAKKQHGRDFLREIAHLRPRTYFIGCVARMRSQMAMAVHRFYQDKGFVYVHTPVITSSDCEGAGEMFQVSTVVADKRDAIPATKDGKVDYKQDFFGKPAFLTVSGQLEAESYCCALSDVYTFGPTFRAENSHTSRHLAEFWMIEPEMAFADLKDNMDLAEEFIKYLCTWALTNCATELEWLDKNVEVGLIQRLKEVTGSPFQRLTYTEAVEILEKETGKFDDTPKWGKDLATEHEKHLTDVIYKKPVIVYNYPKEFKSFYMRENDDGKTVAAMDCLLPTIGEVIGGSQREERPEVLDRMIKEKGLAMEPYWWYRDLRKYGTVPHAGFGLGFERLVMMVTGVPNIRDVIPFPRYPGHCEY